MCRSLLRGNFSAALLALSGCSVYCSFTKGRRCMDVYVSRSIQEVSYLFLYHYFLCEAFFDLFQGLKSLCMSLCVPLSVSTYICCHTHPLKGLLWHNSQISPALTDQIHTPSIVGTKCVGEIKPACLHFPQFPKWLDVSALESLLFFQHK